MVDPQLVVRWAVAAAGTILNVAPDAGGWLPDEFSALRGFRPLNVHDCAGLAELAALEFAILARHHGR